HGHQSGGILLHDPTALVTMGFFPPGAAPGWYVETSSLLAEADLDFFDFHAYSGHEALGEVVEAFGMQSYEGKPIILGEYGAFRHIYTTLESAARAVTAWQSESCDHGFDGWLYWTYYPADAHINDRTWGLVDESGFLLDMLAPNSHPDPCELVIIPQSNIAFGKTVRASASLGAEPPSNLVDENYESQWGAGRDAPQWIEVDLGAAHVVREIRLLVAQWPEGATVHRILARGSDGDFVELVRFSQSTAEGDWLVFTPESPLEDIQFIRIETLSSPSWVAWKEIEVYGELME
ncbi:MAG: discoidin domain-containing protein, partial [Anaerolineae bacterium]|nr:discoidin domain-containing protein [Anaerolineae bacterium]